MIKVKDYRNQVVELEVHALRYPVGGQLGLALIEPESEDTYTVVSRNIPEYSFLLEANQTLIPDEDDQELVKPLIEKGILIRTNNTFPYNFYTMRIYDVCFEKVDVLNLEYEDTDNN